MRRVAEDLNEMQRRERRRPGADGGVIAECQEIVREAFGLLVRALPSLDRLRSQFDGAESHGGSRDWDMAKTLDHVREVEKMGGIGVSPIGSLARAAEKSRQNALLDLADELGWGPTAGATRWSCPGEVLEVISGARNEIVEKVDAAAREASARDAELPEWVTASARFADEWQRLENAAAALSPSPSPRTSAPTP